MKSAISHALYKLNLEGFVYLAFLDIGDGTSVWLARYWMAACRGARYSPWGLICRELGFDGEGWVVVLGWLDVRSLEKWNGGHRDWRCKDVLNA